MKKSVRLLVIALLALSAVGAFAQNPTQEYELINPASVVKIEPMVIHPHPSTLEGKTVLLHANSKQNADKIMDKLEELLKQNVKNINVINLYKVRPETWVVSENEATSKKIGDIIASYHPDLVITGTAD